MHLSGFLWKLTATLEVNVLSPAASFWTLRSALSRRSTDSSAICSCRCRHFLWLGTDTFTALKTKTLN